MGPGLVNLAVDDDDGDGDGGGGAAAAARGIMGLLGAGSLWWVGVVLSVFGALFGSLGDNLIKLSYTKEALAVEAGQPKTPLACRPMWWGGMLCIIVLNTSMTLAAYSFADASLTIPFAGLHICFNVGFARLLNSEVFTSRQLGFTLLILIGVTIVLTAGNHDTVVFRVSEIEKLFQDVGFFVMTLCILMLITILALISHFHFDARARCFASSALVGSIAAITQVTAKITSENLTQAVGGDAGKVFSHWVVYVAMFSLVAAALSQLILLNRALSRYNAFVVVPVYNSFLIVLGSLYAAVLFKEYERWPITSMILMPLGVLSTAVGVGLLAWDHNPEERDELAFGLRDEGDIALMPRSHSFPVSPVLDDELVSNLRASQLGRRGHSYHHDLRYLGGSGRRSSFSPLSPLRLSDPRMEPAMGDRSDSRLSFDAGMAPPRLEELGETDDDDDDINGDQDSRVTGQSFDSESQRLTLQ